jgi:flagellin-like hook-associated protein FlgL
MRVTHRMIADTVNFNLQRSLKRLDNYSNQLSTGKAFHRPSDNPVGVGRVMSYTAAVDRNEQFRLNMNQTKGWLENTEYGLQNGLDVLQRVRELSIYGANESLTAEDRRAIAPEVLEFLDHFIGIANTETNGLYIFGGHQTLKVPFIREKAYHISDSPDSGIDRTKQNELQSVDLSAATGGTFTLEYEGMVTAPIAFDATAATVENSLKALANIGLADVTVSGADGGPFTIEFTGQLAEKNVAEMIIDDSGLTTAGTAAVTTTTPGKGGVLVNNFQNGNYTFNQIATTPTSNEDGATTVKQSFLQGNAVSIIGGAEWGNPPVGADVNSSVLLEVSGVNSETGEVNYIYTAHEYDKNGAYTKQTGTFSLTFGGTSPQPVTIGSTTLDVTGLDAIPATAAGGLRVGDRTVLNLTPSITAGNDYERVTLNGQHRDNESGFNFIFDEGAIDATADSNIIFNYFSLDTFDRSPSKGAVYDGSMNLTYDNFEASEPALTFSYDSLGFPVYYGDSNDRIQEISPFQEMTMNINGERAFGENQEVFEAVFDIYWALIDNDREALGDTALKKIDSAIEHFLGRLAEVGARSNRVEAMHDTLSTENLYLREVRSNIEDIDLANVISEFKMQENAYRAALATSSMMLQPTLVDYLR